jgi:hypothetical protein
MPETVATVLEPESQEAPEAPEAQVAEATQTEEDVATVKRRLAGTHQALTRAQQERDAIKAERDALAAEKAAREEAEMTELEKALKRVADLEASNKDLAAKATLEEMARKYPLAVEALDGELLPPEKLEALENRLKAAASPVPDDEPEPRVLSNTPRRPAVEPPKTGTDRLAELRQRVATEMPDEMWQAIRGAGAQRPGN